MKACALSFLHRRVAAAIRDQRTALGLSQAALAERVGRPTDYVGKIERGVQNITLKTLERVLTALVEASITPQTRSVPSPSAAELDFMLLHAFAVSLGVIPAQTLGRSTPEVTPGVRRLLRVLREPMTRQALQNALGLKAEKNFRLVYLRPAIDSGMVSMTIPQSPNSRLQKYRLTAKARAWLSTAVI